MEAPAWLQGPVLIGAISLLIVLLAGIWWWAPRWSANRLRLKVRDAKARADIEDNFRKTLSQLFGGVAVLLGAALRLLPVPDHGAAPAAGDAADQPADLQRLRAAWEPARSSSAWQLVIYCPGGRDERLARLPRPIVEALAAFIRVQHLVSGTRQRTAAPNRRCGGGTDRPGTPGSSGGRDRPHRRDRDKTPHRVASDLSSTRLPPRRRPLRCRPQQRRPLRSHPLRGQPLRSHPLRGQPLRRPPLPRRPLRCRPRHNADLSGAFLNGANLNGANLNGAVLLGARLSGADLSEVVCDAQTKLPPGVQLPCASGTSTAPR